jgi:transcriptional regulator with XRE-family HTH domain
MTNCLGTKIKELRLLHEMSQEELGRRVGVQRAAINKYEKGTVTNIPISTIEEIAKVFDVSPAYLVGWDNISMYNPLSLEVKVLQGVKHFYGSEAIDILEVISNVDKVGLKRLLQYAYDVERLYSKADDDDYHYQ